MSDDTTPARSNRPTERPAPNFAARRMLASTVAITLIVIAGVMVYRFVTGGDANLLSARDVDWNRIVLIDETTGGSVSVSIDGDKPITNLATAGRVNTVHVGVEHIVLETSTSLHLGPVEADTEGNGDDENPQSTATPATAAGQTTVITIPSGVDVHRLDTVPMLFALAEPNGGNLTIVDPVGDRTIDLGEMMAQADPRLFVETLHYDPSGTRFAVADTTNFQTVVVTFDDDEPLYLPDIPIAVGTEAIATTQIVGDRADTSMFDIDGTNIASAATGIIAAATLERHNLRAVTATGEHLELERDDREATALTPLGVPAGSAPLAIDQMHDGDRYLVRGDVFVSLLDGDGATLFTTTFPQPIEPMPPLVDANCIAIGGEGELRSLISADTGGQVADLSGYDRVEPVNDGCTMLGYDHGIEYLNIDPDAELGTLPTTHRFLGAASVWLSPDGSVAIVRRSGGATELQRWNDETEGFELVAELSGIAPDSLSVAFVE